MPKETAESRNLTDKLHSENIVAFVMTWSSRIILS